MVRRISWLENVPLNDSHPDLLVNYVECTEDGPAGRRTFIWVTDLPVKKTTVGKIVRAGRHRWRIENETFNTLKNQGYHFEHNYGHGEENLCVVFAHLMLLAFLVDQVQQRLNKTFQAASVKVRTRRALWEKVRGLFEHYFVPSMESIYAAIANDVRRIRTPLPKPDSS